MPSMFHSTLTMAHQQSMQTHSSPPGQSISAATQGLRDERHRCDWGNDSEVFINFLLEHKAEAGNGINFTDMVFNKAAAMLVPYYMTGAAKTAKARKGKWLKEEYILVTTIMNLSGFTWDPNLGVNLPHNNNAWSTFTAGVPLYDTMSLLLPNKAKGKHTFHLSNQTFGLAFGTASEGQNQGLFNKDVSRQGSLMAALSASVFNVPHAEFPPGESAGLGDQPMVAEPMSSAMAHLMPSAKFSFQGSDGLLPGWNGDQTVAAGLSSSAQEPSQMGSLSFLLGSGGMQQGWDWSRGLLSPDDGSLPMSSSSSLKTPSSQKPSAPSAKRKSSALKAFPSGMQSAKSETSSKKWHGGGGTALMNRAHDNFMMLCSTMNQVAVSLAGNGPNALHASMPPSSPTIVKVSPSSGPPISPQKKAVKKRSRAEHAAATLEFMQLNEGYLMFEQQTTLMDYFLSSDGAVKMYLSIISPEPSGLGPQKTT
ncbi:hypothetical protein K439DRAFT_1613191 [Ramaria rubella]|nr:hypothetical protein K439DRAFT_1613191 [Ramaria rubella]